jgi:hypothetical protein
MSAMCNHADFRQAKKRLLLLALASPYLVSAYLIYAYTAAPPPGYCAIQKRVIPDQEICRNRFDSLIKAGRLKLDQSEANGSDYLKHHPSYCSVGRDNTTGLRLGGIFDIFIDDTIVVSFQFDMTEQEKDRWSLKRRTIWEQWDRLSPCGKVLEQWAENS